ncbi:MAG: desulfoferrodoxin [Bacilli bacterium]|nr:desulfoferrodoxin [Bacilli bacterium]
MKFFRCKRCKKIIALVKDVPVPTICCGEAMEELIPNTQDGAHEKHIPVINVENNIVTVKVGEINHPMLPEHYIEWIMIQTNFGNQRKILKPGDAPIAKFALLEGEEVIRALEYCNIHGLYSNK